MWQAVKKFKGIDRHTRFFIFNWVIYLLAIFWTTIQAYARLEYSRSDMARPIVIHIQPSDHS